jgi:hypothetical protein
MTVNTMENIQSQGLHTPQKGTTAHCNKTGQSSTCQKTLHPHLLVVDCRMVQKVG